MNINNVLLVGRVVEVFEKLDDIDEEVVELRLQIESRDGKRIINNIILKNSLADVVKNITENTIAGIKGEIAIDSNNKMYILVNKLTYISGGKDE